MEVQKKKKKKRFERLTFDMEKAMCECTHGCGFVVSDRILHSLSTSLKIGNSNCKYLKDVFKNLKYTRNRLAVLTGSSSV